MTAGDENLVLVTAMGVVKQVTAEEVLGTKSGKAVIALKGNDRVVAAFRAPAGVDIMVVASDGQCLRTPLESVSIQGRGAGGVAGLKLKGDAVVVGAGPLIGDGIVLTITSESGAKATPFEEFESKGRGGQGVRIARLGSGETITLAWFGALGSIGGAGDLLAQMADDEDPKKLDPNPVPFELEATKRDLVPTKTERQVMVLGPSRW